MVLKQHLSAKLTQRLVITPSLQQAIKMLQLNKLELESMLQQELTENPVLEEETDEKGTSDQSDDGLNNEDNRPTQNAPVTEEVRTSKENDPNSDPFDKIDVEAFFSDYMETGAGIRQSYEINPEMPTFENTLSKPTSLADHLTWQLELSTNDPLLKKIGRAIIGNLNRAGYLQADIDEIAAMDPEFSSEMIEKALELVRGFDPSGIAARDLQECLLLQINSLDIDSENCRAIIENHLEDLQTRDYDKIIKGLKISREEMKHYLDLIRQLDPKPGLRYNEERVIYIEPEVFVEKVEDEYKISLNDDGMPKLRINPWYQNAAILKESGNAEAEEFIKEKMKKALWLLKSYDQRQKTIYKVASSIIDRQKDFFEYGVDHMKPMILSDIANDIDMHESTVSRVVNNKYMHTPSGVFEMKYFFQRGISSYNGDDISSVTVKRKVEQMVQQESKKSPLSDAKIAEHLEREGLRIARRTIAKYREELNIPSSSKRKKKI